MIYDYLLRLADQQSVTADGVGNISANISNNNPAPQTTDKGIGTPASVVVCCLNPEATGKMQVELITSDNEDLSSPSVLMASGEIDVSQQKEGIVWSSFLPRGDYKKFLGVKFANVSAPVGVKIDAFITYHAQGAPYYKNGTYK